MFVVEAVPPRADMVLPPLVKVEPFIVTAYPLLAFVPTTKSCASSSLSAPLVSLAKRSFEALRLPKEIVFAPAKTIKDAMKLRKAKARL